MNANGRNSFAALEDAEEIIKSAEEQKNENKKEKEDQVVHLKHPLIWIDLEMTGKHSENASQALKLFLRSHAALAAHRRF